MGKEERRRKQKQRGGEDKKKKGGDDHSSEERSTEMQIASFLVPFSVPYLLSNPTRVHSGVIFTEKREKAYDLFKTGLLKGSRHLVTLLTVTTKEKII